MNAKFDPASATLIYPSKLSTSIKLRILIIDTAKRTRNSYIPLAILDAFRRNPNVEFVVIATYNDSINQFQSNQCNTLVAIGGSGCELPIIERLCSMAMYRILWTTEDPYEEKENVSISSIFDRIFTNERNSVAMYGGKAIYMPLAASAKYHLHSVLENNEDYYYDLLFIGTAWPNRVKLLDQFLGLLVRNRNIRLKIGLSYNEHIPHSKLGIDGLITDWRVSNPNFAKMCNRSRIVLCLNRDFSSADPRLSKGTSPPPRLFESAAAGGFQLIVGDGQDIAPYFDRGREIFCAEDERELAQLALYYLNNPSERIIVAKASYERVLREHLYDHRISYIIEDVITSLGKDIFKGSRSIVHSVRKRILMVTHNIINKGSYGGVEVYQDQLRKMDDVDVYLLYPFQNNTLVLHLPNDAEILFSVPELLSPDVLSDDAWMQAFEKILVLYRIDIVHFQHLLGWPLSMPLVTSALGIPSVFTFHDYYLVCKRFNLISFENRYCDIANHKIHTCDICLNAVDSSIAIGSQAKRRNFVALITRSFDKIIFNTNFSKDYFKSIYSSMPEQKLICIEMMLPETGINKVVKENINSHKSKIVVVVLGNITFEKGADTLIRLINNCRDSNVEFRLLGRINMHYKEVINALNFKNCVIRDGYEQYEVAQLLVDADLSLHLSIWPETYVISLSEAWAAGVVPLVASIGALSERVHHGVDGLVVPVGDIGGLAYWINRLAEDSEFLQNLKNTIHMKNLCSPSAHRRELKLLYDELLNNHITQRVQFKFFDRDFALTLECLGIRTNNPRWDNNEILEDSRLESINESSLIETFNGEGDFNVWLCEMPSKWSYVQSVELKNDFCIDRLVLDGIQVDLNANNLDVRHELKIVGWALNPEIKESPLETYLLLGAIHERFALLKQINRDDVARHYQLNLRENTYGFSNGFLLDDVPPSAYEIIIVQAYARLICYYSTGTIINKNT